MPSFGERLIAAHQAGVAERQKAEAIERDKQDRELQKQQLKLQMDHLKHQQAIEDFKLQYGALQGAPAQRKPVESLPGIGAPPSVIGQTATGSAGLQQQMPNPSLTIPGSNIQVQPQTLEELFRRRQAEDQQLSQAKIAEASQIEAAKSPFNIQPLGASGGVSGVGTPQEKIIPGAPGRESLPTSAIQEYQFYAQQEIAAGKKPLSFDAWQQREATRRPPTLAPVIIQTPTGFQQVDRNTRTASPITTAGGDQVQLPPTADQRNKVEARLLVGRSIGAVKQLGDQIITRVGPAQRLDAIKRGAEAVFGKDPNFRTYQDARMALAGNLAVAQQGSRPSDADIKAIWLPLVPDPYRDTKESSDLKWGLINTMSNTTPLTFDGFTFPNEAALNEYKRRTQQ